MKKHLFTTLIFLLCALVIPAQAASKAPAPTGKTATGEPQQMGVQVAQTISMLTGVAVSPLLGMSAVGAWRYYHAPAEQRPNLPWFAQPWFWVPALLLVALCFAKDTLGTAAPTALKKPLDVAETVEHKVSGLVATGAFVPIAAAIFTAPGGGSASLGAAGFAALDLHWLYNGIMVPISMAAFFVVFLASTAINILILISPFTTVDAALKSIRLALLATIAGTAWANPWIGAAWALILVAIAWFIAGWSFRMFHFGSTLLWDLLTFRRHRFEPRPEANWLFLSRKLNKVPVRTYGKLSLDAPGNLVLKYRPWLFLPERTLTLPAGQYAVGHGLLYSEIVKLEGEDTRSVLFLPPRYRGHEEQLVPIYKLTGVQPAGLRAVWRWIKGALGFRPKLQPAA